MIKKKITLILTLVAILTISFGLINFESKVNKVQADTVFNYELNLDSAPKSELNFSYAVGDNMLYQQLKPAVVWGFCPAGRQVTVSLLKQKGDVLVDKKVVTANSQGLFETSFEGQKASYTEYKIVATDGEKEISAEHILFGELYLSCGQSNMGLNVQYCSNAKEIMDGATNPYIRVYMAPTFSSSTDFSYLPTYYDTAGVWITGDSPVQIGGASAVSYNFILKMFEELNKNGNEVPCGFLNTAKGATSIEAWISRASINTDNVVYDYLSERNRLLDEDKFNTNGSNNYNQVSAMFNSSIAPLSRLYVKGILWYQGENNVGNEVAGNYFRSALKLLRKDWSKWYNGGTEDLPLFFVSLTPNNCSKGNASYKPENLAYMWEGMAEAYKDDPELLSMVTTYDIPQDWYDESFAYRAPWHTLTKKPVGERLATYALNKLYDGFEGHISAPVYKDAKFENGKAIVSFSNVKTLKTTNNLDVVGFTLCGENRIFYPAKATILNDGTVSVYSEWVKEPVAVAYAFAMMIQASNLCNEEGHVVAPFRSDKVASVFYSSKDWQNCDSLQLWISKGSDTSRTPDLAQFKDAYSCSGNLQLSVAENGYYGNAIKLDYTLRGKENFSFTPILHQDGVYEQFADYDTLFFRVKNLQNRKLSIDKVEVTLANGTKGNLVISDSEAITASIEKVEDYQSFSYSLKTIDVNGTKQDISEVRASIKSLTIYFKDYMSGSILIDDFMVGNIEDFVELSSPSDDDNQNGNETDTPIESSGCGGEISSNSILLFSTVFVAGIVFLIKKAKKIN